MITRRNRMNLRPMLGIAAIAILAACSSPGAPAGSPSASASITLAASPGERLGALPGVEGFAYRASSVDVPGFVEGANATLDGDAEVEIIQASVASRGDDDVSVIAFTFPGADDTQSIDYFARVIDDMEDGLQAGSERGLGGSAYLITAHGQTVVLAPFGRADSLVFLFLAGPVGPTEDLATAILDAEE